MRGHVCTRPPAWKQLSLGYALAGDAVPRNGTLRLGILQPARGQHTRCDPSRLFGVLTHWADSPESPSQFSDGHCLMAIFGPNLLTFQLCLCSASLTIRVLIPLFNGTYLFQIGKKKCPRFEDAVPGGSRKLWISCRSQAATANRFYRLRCTGIERRPTECHASFPRTNQAIELPTPKMLVPHKLSWKSLHVFLTP